MSTPVRGRWVKASKRRGIWISSMEIQEGIDVSLRPSCWHWLLLGTVLRVRDAGSGQRVTKRQHSYLRRSGRIKASRAEGAVGAPRLLGCPA
jgi:hypothetical protein